VDVEERGDRRRKRMGEKKKTNLSDAGSDVAKVRWPFITDNLRGSRPPYHGVDGEWVTRFNNTVLTLSENVLYI